MPVYIRRETFLHPQVSIPSTEVTQDLLALSITLPEAEHCCDRGFHTFASLRYRFPKKGGNDTHSLSFQTLAAEFNSQKFERRCQMEGASVCCVLWLDAMETEQRRLLLCVCTALQKSDEIGMCLASSHCLRVCIHFIWHKYTQHHHLSLTLRPTWNLEFQKQH